MSERLDRYLDGEIGIEALDSADRAEARAWEAMFVDLRSRGLVRAPRGLTARVMEEAVPGPARAGGGAAAPAGGSALESEPSVAGDSGRGHGLSGLWRTLTWPFRPIRVPVPPALALAAGAALALLVFVWRGERAATGPAAGSGVIHPASLETPSAPSASRVYVELRFKAPGASSVAVAGDFDNWQPSIALRDPDGDGMWTGLVPMSPGVHQYMFVVDGTKWVTDPGALRHVDDGFGHRNAVVAVPAPSGA